jgi:hypothetical protein
VPSHEEKVERRARFLAWVGLLGAPVLWFLQLELSVALTPWICQTRSIITYRIITAVFLICALAVLFLAWRNYVASSRVQRETHSFMSLLGIMLSVLFGLLIFAQGLPSFFFDPCQS